MRLLALALLAGCSREPEPHWTRFLGCDRHDGVTAQIVSIDHHRIQRQLYPVGRFLGMSDPIDDEVIVEVCNGTDAPIQVAERSTWPWKSDGSCEPLLGPRLKPQEAMRFNHWRPAGLPKYPPTIELDWRQGGTCGNVYAR